MRGCTEPGSLVEVRGQRWLLTRTQRFEQCAILSLEGRERANAMERTEIIEPFDTPRPASSVSLEHRRRHFVLTHALSSIHSVNPSDGLWTAATARIDLHAYQLEPALAVVGGATRLLIADGVGLGKTIQAGLVLSELLQRGWIMRALIVCPAGLRDTWQRELRERFGIAATILDQQSIADRVASFPPGVNPWAADTIGIVSIDFIKRDEVMAALAAVPIDLLIADEAHHLTPGSDRGAALSILASRAAWCVLVSATPHSGNRAAFEYLINIGAHSDNILVFRRSRSDIGWSHRRRTRFLRVPPDRDEQALLAGIERYSRTVWAGRGQREHPARLVAITIARRASSSVLAVERTLRRRRGLLSSAPREAAQPVLPWEDVDDGDGDETVLSAPGFDDVVEERTALDELIGLASRCRSSAKMSVLTRLLSRINEPVIVFTEYRDTLEGICNALRDSRRVRSIHGAMPREMRTAAVDAFNGGACDVLVATDAAGEGLNLHHRCRVVVDFELAWNPLRLEQRVGRVDRLGQRRSVHALRLYHHGTIEQEVLDRLALRGLHAERDLDRTVSESEVAAAVFTSSAIVRGEVPTLRCSTAAAAAVEAARLLNRRRFQDRADGRYFSTHRSSTRIVLLRRETFTNAHGITVGNRVTAEIVALARRPGSRREWRIAIGEIAKRVAHQRQGDELLPAQDLGRRLLAIRRHLARQQRREHQRSLFYAHQDDQAHRDEGASRLDAALRRIEQAIAPPDPERTICDVVAAWPARHQ